MWSAPFVAAVAAIAYFLLRRGATPALRPGPAPSEERRPAPERAPTPAKKAEPATPVAWFGKAEAALGLPSMEAEQILGFYRKAAFG